MEQLSKIPVIPGIAKSAFYGVVVAAALYGAIKGFGKWFQWWWHREKLIISIEIVEPVVNISRDAGMFAWFVGATAVISSIIAATCPISVPLLYLFFGKKKGNTSSGKTLGN